MKTEMFMCQWHESNGTMCANLIVRLNGTYYYHEVECVCGELKGNSGVERSTEMYSMLVDACKKDTLDVSKMVRVEQVYNEHELNWHINNKKSQIL